MRGYFVCLLTLTVICHAVDAKKKARVPLRDLVTREKRSDYIKAAEDGGYECRPKVGIALDASLGMGRQAFVGHVKDIVKAIETQLSRLPFEDGTVGQGPDLFLFPFNAEVDTINLKTPGRRNIVIQEELDEFFDNRIMDGGSCLACAIDVGGKYVHRIAKRKSNPSYLIVISNGASRGDFRSQIIRYHKRNLKYGIKHMMVGVAGNNDEVERKNLGPFADKGISRLFWEPSSDEDIKDLALKIADEIAADSCFKV